MEKYVRTTLVKSSGTTNANEQDSESKSLQRLIATEKGLLKSEDFEHLQKVIEVYSKVLLCQVRQQHTLARAVLYKAKDWASYIDLIFKQQKTEVKLFNAATMEILTIANIKPTVFNQSVGLFTALANDSVCLKYMQLSFYSPFSYQLDMSATTAKRLLKRASDSSMAILQQMKQHLKGQEETMIVFDCLLTDYLKQEQGIEVDMWRAACFQHKLHEDSEEVLQILVQICKDVKQLT